MSHFKDFDSDYVAKKQHDKNPVQGIEFFNDPHLATRAK